MRGFGFKRRIGLTCATALVVLAGTVMAGATRTAYATGLDIFVGYADDSRAGAANFPTPWSGAPNTVFIGSGAPWDAGAIRLVNSGGSPVLVSSVAVDLHHGPAGASGPVFNLWGAFAIPANGQAILTQTAQFNFDTSDFAFQPCGTPAPASDPRIPTVTVTVGGTPTTSSDTGHVLDTFGYDSACLGNESIQWTHIGRAACAGSSLALAPPSQSATVGSTATVAATFTNSCGEPLANVVVSFKVLSGPNSGLTGTAVTDASGKATFTYSSASLGTDTLQASVTNPAGTINSNTVSVTWTDQQIIAQGTTISATEGKALTTNVATFTDPDTNATAAEYRATILWGDGNSSGGTITGGRGMFSVSGTHTYTEEGTYHVTVTVTDVDNSSNKASANSTANVADAALTASAACSSTSLQSYNGPTATLTDAATPSGTLSDFTATIDWGDGTVTLGTVTGINGGPYTVSGSHVYATTGNFTITTKIKDVGGSKAETSCNTLAFSFAPGGGSFVIGDQNAVIGNSVTFWGAQWAKLNSLSGGNAPRSFKGFAENPLVPACGISWSADPGNSTPPPPGPLPAFMGVIVTSSADKSGSTISGDTAHIVIVQTDPGYAPDPGHAGTGTVVAMVC